MMLSLGTLEIKEKNHAYLEMVSVITMRQKAFTDSIMNTLIVGKVVASVIDVGNARENASWLSELLRASEQSGENSSVSGLILLGLLFWREGKRRRHRPCGLMESACCGGVGTPARSHPAHWSARAGDQHSARGKFRRRSTGSKGQRLWWGLKAQKPGFALCSLLSRHKLHFLKTSLTCQVKRSQTVIQGIEQETTPVQIITYDFHFPFYITTAFKITTVCVPGVGLVIMSIISFFATAPPLRQEQAKVVRLSDAATEWIISTVWCLPSQKMRCFNVTSQIWNSFGWGWAGESILTSLKMARKGDLQQH